MTRRPAPQFEALPIFFINDAELGRAILGDATEGERRQAIAYFERLGLPPADPGIGRRNLDAVRKFFRVLYSIDIPGMLPARDGVDRPEEWGKRRKRE